MPRQAWPRAESPFHAGELAVQERLGRREENDKSARLFVHDRVTESFRLFLEGLPFVVVGSVDTSGQPWTSLLPGSPGFLSSPDPLSLEVAARPRAEDPLASALAIGHKLAILAIESPTRRRIRVNGEVVQSDERGFVVRPDQAYGNCPQYIQAYDLHPRTALPSSSAAVRGDRLSPADRALVEQADTFYIASANLDTSAGVARGVDVSHRGGRPGFVGVEDEHTLVVPDFVGNYLFNTLGNLLVLPRAGLLFVDRAAGDLLLVAARAEIVWEGPDVEAFTGAQRLLRLTVTATLRLPGAFPFDAGAPGYARELPRTGTWEESRRAQAARAADRHWRPFVLTATKGESASVRSFVFVPADGDALVPHRAGQFLPIRVPAGPGGAPLVRPYSLSDAPNGKSYRISVKRDGVVSSWLHEHLGEGTTIEALAPRGDFLFDESSRRPALLLSAGVGITPMIAFLRSLLVNDGRSRTAQTLTFVHVARSGSEFPFAEDIVEMAEQNENLLVHVAFTAPRATDVHGHGFDSRGRLDAAGLTALLAAAHLAARELDVYLCGPSAFMQGMYDALRSLGTPDEQIRFEAFAGKAPRRSASRRNVDEGDAVPADAPRVRFARSGTTRPFLPRFETLLECAEDAGLAIPYSCRSGVCGTCATRLLGGSVRYVVDPVAERGADEVLVCCARPATSDVELDA